jgi:hypothetical protein
VFCRRTRRETEEYYRLVNYLDDLPILRDEVLPRLERMGLRRALRTVA